REPIALTRDRHPLHAADWRFRLASRGPEGAEVMLTLEHRRRLRHGFGIERAMDPGGAMREQAGARSAIEDQIPVRARLGRVARVKMRGYGAYPGNADVAWQVGVGSQRPCPHAAACGGVEMRDLPAGVDARVGPAGADEAHRLGRHLAQGPLGKHLDRLRRGLALPAGVTGTVVLESDRNTRH